jgi:hypothetical protein
VQASLGWRRQSAPQKCEREAQNEKGSAEALPFPLRSVQAGLGWRRQSAPQKCERDAQNEKGSAEALPFPFETLERSQS